MTLTYPKKTKLNSHRFTGFGVLWVTMVLITSSCSDSNNTSTTTTNLGSAVSSAILAASQHSPHALNASVVTTSNSLWKSNHLQWVKKLGNWAVPSCYATSTGLTLSGIWNTGSDAQPEGGAEVGITNLYNGGGWTCGSVSGTDGSYSSCTKAGFPTIPGSVYLKDYMGQDLDPNFLNSNSASVTPFGRLQSALQVTCALGYLVTSVDADGTPTAGTQTVNFPTDTSHVVYKSFANGGCNMDTSMAGQSISPTISAVTSTNFTKKMALTVPGGNSVTLYLGLNLSAGNLNFMQVEDQANSGGRDAMDRSILIATGLNLATTTNLRFEYTSMGYNGTRNGSSNCWSGSNWQCSFEFHRIFIDGANDVAYLISNSGDPGDASGTYGSPVKYVQFSAAGKPIELGQCTSSSCSANLALSVGLAGQNYAGGGAATTTSDYNGCIDARTRAVTIDNTLACDITGTAINSGSVSAVINQSRVFFSTLSNLTATTENTTLSFVNGTQLYTNADTQ